MTAFEHNSIINFHFVKDNNGSSFYNFLNKQQVKLHHAGKFLPVQEDMKAKQSRI